MTDDDTHRRALDTAAELLGHPRQLPLGDGEPAVGIDFRRLATNHTFGDSWTRTRTLDARSRALISVAIAATLGTHEPLRGQLHIALNNGVTKDEIVELFTTSRPTPAPHERSTVTRSPCRSSPGTIDASQRRGDGVGRLRPSESKA